VLHRLQQEGNKQEFNRYPMTKKIIVLLSIIITGLIAGIILGISIGYNPHGLSAHTYVEQQQHAIRGLNTLMPILGFIAVALAITSAVLQREDKPVLIILLGAAALLITSGVVTRFGNQPINAIVMTWNIDSIPENWTTLRDKWWAFHIIRTVSALVAFFLIALTVARNQKL
jgi:hypothetical protein